MIGEDFKSDKYSAVLDNLKENGYLDQKDVDELMQEFISAETIILHKMDEKKAKIVSEALLENFKRLRSD